VLNEAPKTNPNDALLNLLSLPPLPVVFRMRQNIVHEQLLSVEVDGGDHPVFVATNVEDVKLTTFRGNHIHACECSLQFLEVLKASIPGEFKPCSQRPSSIAVLCSKLPQRLLRNNMHPAGVYLNLRFNCKRGR
jgi:hypothetical protein